MTTAMKLKDNCSFEEKLWSTWIRSDQITHSVVSDSLRPHESQHARPPCPSPTPRIHWDSCPSSQWCHPAISSSIVPCPQSIPASESFPMSQLLAWGGQSTGVSALASFLLCFISLSSISALLHLFIVLPSCFQLDLPTEILYPDWRLVSSLFSSPFKLPTWSLTDNYLGIVQAAILEHSSP